MLTVGYNPTQERVLVLSALLVKLMTKVLKHANIVLKVNTNQRRARLLVSSVKKVQNKWGATPCRFAQLVVWASTSQQKAKQHVSTVLTENLKQKQDSSNVLVVIQGHIRMKQGRQYAEIVVLGSTKKGKLEQNVTLAQKANIQPVLL